MVGTWRGSRPNDRWAYMVFTADRRGCAWIREGDDFARRFDEIQFSDWTLVADQIDDDTRMPLNYAVIGGDTFDIDEYDLANDRILPAGVTELPNVWIDVAIDCADSGTDATATDVERLGILGNGSTGNGTPPGTTDTGLGPVPP